jgi:hypothetical protein
MFAKSLQKTLGELISLLKQLTDETYATPCTELSNATIGEHTRHSIELFQCLLSQYDSGKINYDQRARNVAVQTQTQTAIQALEAILQDCDKPNKSLELHQQYDGHSLHISTTYHRELLYTLDHCIHHQALIKVALHHTAVEIDPDFGVARSTIAYRAQCAQ